MFLLNRILPDLQLLVSMVLWASATAATDPSQQQQYQQQQELHPRPCTVVAIFGLRTADCAGLSLDGIPLTLPKSSALTDVAVLWLADNDLASLPANVFSSWTNLQEIHLSRNKIVSVERGAWRGLRNLQRLDLTGNRLTTIGAFFFHDVHESSTFSTVLSTLRYLSLGSNPIRIISEGAFHNLSNLEELNLENCQLTEFDLVAQMNGLDHLTSLNLDNNELTGFCSDACGVMHTNGVSSLYAESGWRSSLLPESNRYFLLPSSLNVLRLYGNRWRCDCRLRSFRQWLSKSQVNWDFGRTSPSCSSPDLLSGISWRYLSFTQFACTPQIHVSNVTGTNAYIRAGTTRACALRCDVTGYPPPSITWFRHSRPLGNVQVRSFPSSFYPQRRLTPDVLPPSADNLPHVTSCVLLSNATKEVDAGDYRCVANNSAGRSEVHFKLIVFDGLEPYLGDGSGGFFYPSDFDDYDEDGPRSVNTSSISRWRLEVIFGTIAGAVTLAVLIALVVVCAAKRRMWHRKQRCAYHIGSGEEQQKNKQSGGYVISQRNTAPQLRPSLRCLQNEYVASQNVASCTRKSLIEKISSPSVLDDGFCWGEKEETPVDSFLDSNKLVSLNTFEQNNSGWKHSIRSKSPLLRNSVDYGKRKTADILSLDKNALISDDTDVKDSSIAVNSSVPRSLQQSATETDCSLNFEPRVHAPSSRLFNNETIGRRRRSIDNDRRTHPKEDWVPRSSGSWSTLPLPRTRHVLDRSLISAGRSSVTPDLLHSSGAISRDNHPLHMDQLPSSATVLGRRAELRNHQQFQNQKQQQKNQQHREQQQRNIQETQQHIPQYRHQHHQPLQGHQGLAVADVPEQEGLQQLLQLQTSKKQPSSLSSAESAIYYIASDLKPNILCHPTTMQSESNGSRNSTATRRSPVYYITSRVDDISSRKSPDIHHSDKEHVQTECRQRASLTPVLERNISGGFRQETTRSPAVEAAAAFEADFGQYRNRANNRYSLSLGRSRSISSSIRPIVRGINSCVVPDALSSFQRDCVTATTPYYHASMSTLERLRSQKLSRSKSLTEPRGKSNNGSVVLESNNVVPSSQQAGRRLFARGQHYSTLQDDLNIKLWDKLNAIGCNVNTAGHNNVTRSGQLSTASLHCGTLPTIRVLNGDCTGVAGYTMSGGGTGSARCSARRIALPSSMSGVTDGLYPLPPRKPAAISEDQIQQRHNNSGKNAEGISNTNSGLLRGNANINVSCANVGMYGNDPRKWTTLC